MVHRDGKKGGKVDECEGTTRRSRGREKSNRFDILLLCEEGGII